MALLVCWCLSLSVEAAVASAPLRFLGNADLPPMVWRHNGKAEGVVVDLTNAVAHQAGLSIEVQGADWQQAQDDLKAGKADALVHINPNPQRLAYFDFSEPLLQSSFHIFRKSQNVGITDLNSLAGKKVGVESAGFPVTYLQQYAQISVVVVADWKQAFEMLEAGQIDAVFVDRWVGEYVLFQYKFGDIALVAPAVVSLDSRIAVRKGNSALLASINAGLHAIDRDGTRRAILQKWQAKEVVYLTREAIDRIVLASSLSAAAVLLALCTWLYLQRRKLRKTNAELELRMGDITQLQARLSEQVIRDPLTGLHNRRYLDETLPRDLARAKREGHPLTLVMLDLDHFKQVNDTYGHAGGDEVLKALSKVLGNSARKSDIVCRYGGEEFLIAMPGMSVDQALVRVAQWQEALRNREIRHGEFVIAITFSGGIAAYPDDGADLESLVTKADQALYRAKAQGRNRVLRFQGKAGAGDGQPNAEDAETAQKPQK